MIIMRFLSGKEKKQLRDKLPKGYEVDKKDEIKEDRGILYKNDEHFLIVEKDKYLPHLKSIPEDDYKAVYVDKGAIPFVIKGADLMRPGIVKIDDGIEKDDIILIKDENHNKTIALGVSMYSSDEMKEQEKGKSVKIIHYAGDEKY